VAIRALVVFIREFEIVLPKCPAGLGSSRRSRGRPEQHRPGADAIYGLPLCVIPRAEILLQNQEPLIANTMNLQWPENFACKDKDVHRDRPQITMNINADGHGTNSLVGGISNKKPGAVSRPGTLREFQFHE
jgi:hypothetical protein